MKTDAKNKIESSITIDANREDIWQTLVAFSNYRSWNPAVSHAVAYGRVAPGTEIKMLSGRWDLKFTITAASPPESVEMEGGGVGLRMTLRLSISSAIGASEVKVEAVTGGWIPKVFSKRIRRGIGDSFDLFLTSLQRRVTRGGAYEFKRQDEKPEDDDDGRSSYIPTPFRLLYRTRKRKSRRGRSRLR